MRVYLVGKFALNQSGVMSEDAAALRPYNIIVYLMS